jgi:signal transduction histidine kinase
VDEDSILYEGLQTPEWEAPQLDHTLNTIEFKYALPYFRGDAFPEYQYRIVGLRETWSQWSQQTNRSFVRPPHGSYTFEVRGRTRIGQPAEVASFEFEVLPAWYNTAWAHVFYIVLIGGLVWLLVRLNLRKSMRRQQELQRLLDRRAEEAIRQYDKARQTRIEAERLRTASQLAATIAHEFNNPLSVIAGACDLLTTNHLDKDNHDKWIKRVRKQVDRMSGLVEKLLRIEDLREIDYAAGKKIIDLHVAGLEPPAGAESSDLSPESDDAFEDRPSSHS